MSSTASRQSLHTCRSRAGDDSCATICSTSLRHAPPVMFGDAPLHREQQAKTLLPKLLPKQFAA